MRKQRMLYMIYFLAVLLTEVVIALFVHDRLIRPYIGDILVVVLLYFGVRIFVPVGMKQLPLGIFLFAAGVEILQYFHLVELLGLGHIRFFRIIIGSVFDLKDIVCYGMGYGVIMAGIAVKSKGSQKNSP